ncbi:MAG: ATP-binding protein [Chloroflexota bacterium]
MSSKEYIDQQNKLADQICGSQTEKALEISLATEILAKKIYYKTGEAFSLKITAFCQHLTGDNSSALVNAKRSFEIYQELNIALEMYEVAKLLGRIYWQVGDYPKALQCTINTVDYALQLDDSDREAKARNNLSILYADQGLSDKSLEEIQKAISLYRNNGNVFEENRSIHNLATIHFDFGDLEKASENALIALEFFNKPNSEIEESELETEKANVLSELGRIYAKKQQEEQALTYLNLALASSVKTKSLNIQQAILADIGRVYLKQKELQKAKGYLDQSVELSNLIGSKKGLSECYNALSEIYEQMGDYQSALHYQKFFFKEYESVFGEEQDEKLQQLEVKFRVDSVQREAELLTDKNEALQDLANELDNEVNRKTAELRIALKNEKSLKRSLAIALNKEKEVNRLKSNIINTISHEFRTPLNAIIGYSELLSDDLAESEDDTSFYIEDVNKIQKAGRHLLGLINDALDLSKLEDDNVELEITTFDISATVGHAIESINQEMMSSHNQLSVKNSLPSSEVTSDEAKVKQIITNLLSNAAKFTQNGFVEINIAERDDEFVLIQIKDTGIGIPTENLEHIFEPFFQVESSLSRNYEGNGNGLAIGTNFARLIGGQILVQSDLGTGSTFSFMLPKIIIKDH